MIKQVGRHRIRHGDVTDPGALSELMGDHRADLLYVDPPWGAGMMKIFAALNERQTGQVVEPKSFVDVLTSIFTGAETFCDRYLIVEYGVRWCGAVQDCAKAVGFAPRGIIETGYGSRPKSRGGGPYPMHVHVFTKSPRDEFPADLDQLSGMKGYSMTEFAVGCVARQLRSDGIESPSVLDPCCGMGYTASAAVANGMTFFGNELNAARLARTEGKLR